MKIFIFSYENMNQRSMNQLQKNLLSILKILAKFGQTFGERGWICDITKFACK